MLTSTFTTKATINKYAFFKHRSLAQLKAEEKGKNNSIGWRNTWAIFPLFFIRYWVISLWTITAIGGASSMSMSIDAQFGVNYFGLPGNSGVFTIFTSLPLIIGAATLIPFAIIINKYSIKKVMHFGVFVGLISMVGLWLSYHSPISAFIFICLWGAMVPIGILPNLKLTFQWFKKNRVDLPIALTVGSSAAGGILASFIAPVVYRSINSNSSLTDVTQASYGAGILHQGAILLITIGLILISWFCVLLIREKKTLIGTEYQGVKTSAKRYKKVMKDSQNWVIALMIALMGLPIGVLAWSLGPAIFRTFYTKLPAFSNSLQSDGINFSVSTAISGIILLGYLIGSFAFGWIADLLGRNKAVLWASAIITAGLTFITIISSLSVAEIFVLFFFIGLFVGAQNVGYPMLSQHNPQHLQDEANTLSFISVRTSATIIQNIMSFAVLDPLNFNINSNVMLILPLIMSTTLILGFFLKDTGPKAGQKIKLLNFSKN